VPAKIYLSDQQEFAGNRSFEFSLGVYIIAIKYGLGKRCLNRQAQLARDFSSEILNKFAGILCVFQEFAKELMPENSRKMPQAIYSAVP